MWYAPPKYSRDIVDVNEEFKLIKGDMNEEQAKITLARFLHRNIGFTVQLLTNIQLYPDQIITLKGMMDSNYSLCVWSRGGSKSFIAAVFCILQCIFYPGSNILLAGPTFRTARFIFNSLEKIAENPEAQMLLSCLGVKSKRNDLFSWEVNGGSIVAIPLNGEKIRGFRANILIIDEMLIMEETLVEKVLIPYLIVPQDLKRRQHIRGLEDALVRKGIITDAERTKFVNTAKMIGLSSASFTCQYLYRKFCEYEKQIYNEIDNENAGRYFISQCAWDGFSNVNERMDKSIIELAQSNQANAASFKREYGAQFVDGSDGYYSMNKMIACSISDGEDPTLLLRGKRDRKYILSIDPNFSNSETADHFAMCILELEWNADKKITATIVHQYAEAGKDLKDHINYFHYLLTNFNIEMIIIDHAGYQFVESANESQIFRDSNLNLKIFDITAEKDGQDYIEQLKEAKKNYNKSAQKIVFSQYFTTDFIVKANDWLQACIDYKKIWFGGSIKANPDSFDKAINVNINENLIKKDDLDKGETFMGYFIDNQERLIQQVKYEMASIEIKTTVKGSLSFDLPRSSKMDRSPGRQRRDSYTAVLLGAWAMKVYDDIISTKIETYVATFEPMMF